MSHISRMDCSGDDRCRCEKRECPFHGIGINEKTQECPICVAQDEKNDALSLLASATDLLNSWAREMSVLEAHDEKDIKGVIDRLWSHMSMRLFSTEDKLHVAQNELADLKSKPAAEEPRT